MPRNLALPEKGTGRSMGSTSLEGWALHIGILVFCFHEQFLSHVWEKSFQLEQPGYLGVKKRVRIGAKSVGKNICFLDSSGRSR